MKKYYLNIVFILMLGVAQAQNPLSVGRNQINMGVGLSEWGIPVYFGIDHSIPNDFTIGGELSIRGFREDFRNTYYYHSIFGVSGNGNYHFNRILRIPQNFDFYAGLNLGFYVWSSPPGYDGNYTSGLGLGAQVGGRYYFTKKTGINLEFGGGNAFSGGKFGISIKI